MPDLPSAEYHQSEFQMVEAIGHTELALKVHSQDQVPALTRYELIDAHLLDILDRLDRELPSVPIQQRDAFEELLVQLGNFLGRATQGRLFPKGEAPSESQFHRITLNELRRSLGQDVHEGARQNGGPTDIVYRCIVVELKVERELKDISRLRTKYTQQSAQYASGGGAQLGITCILHWSNSGRMLPQPNYISLEDPLEHSVDAASLSHPARTAVVIIPANLPLPSDFS